MKLKKLLPLASVAGVAAVVAPLVTSCGTKTYSYFFDAANPAINWSPKDTTGKAGQQELKTLQEATDLFMNDISKNPEILADNLVYSIINWYASEGALPDVGSADVKVNKIDKKTGRLSFEFKVDITDYSAGNNINIDLKIDSVVFAMLYSSEWILAPVAFSLRPMQAAMMYLLSDKEWSITCDVSSQYLPDPEKPLYVRFNHESDTQSLQEFIKFIQTDFSLNFNHLYYMQDVTYNPEA